MQYELPFPRSSAQMLSAVFRFLADFEELRLALLYWALFVGGQTPVFCLMIAADQADQRGPIPPAVQLFLARLSSAADRCGGLLTCVIPP